MARRPIAGKRAPSRTRYGRRWPAPRKRLLEHAHFEILLGILPDVLEELVQVAEGVGQLVVGPRIAENPARAAAAFGRQPEGRVNARCGAGERVVEPRI